MRGWTCNAAVFGLLALLLGSDAAFAGRRPRPAPPPPRENPSWVVQGYGATNSDARQDALTNASRSIADYLARHHPDAVWSPPTQYLLDRRLANPADETRIEDLELSGRVHVASLRVEVTPRLLEDAAEQSRRLRMTERHRPLAFSLAGVVALLLVTAGYLQLEDATRGFLTIPLRVSAAILAAAVIGAVLVLA